MGFASQNLMAVSGEAVETRLTKQKSPRISAGAGRKEFGSLFAQIFGQDQVQHDSDERRRQKARGQEDLHGLA